MRFQRPAAAVEALGTDTACYDIGGVANQSEGTCLTAQCRIGYSQLAVTALKHRAQLRMLP
jgi:hypothetical protein